MKKYFYIWQLTAQNALSEAFVNRGSNALFFLGKAVRFGFSLFFLILIRRQISEFSGYTADQLIIFFLTYNLIDTISQVFYRGVYMFTPLVRTGEFDHYLAKPINPLFRALTGKPDINDTVFLIPTILMTVGILAWLQLEITAMSLIWYFVLLINGLIITTALHILVLVIALLTVEIDGVIWMYRDLMRMAQFPVSIYMEPVRFALFFLVPVGLAITIPAEFLLQQPPSYSLLTTTAFGVGFFILSLRIWNWGLKQYSSASS